MIVALYCIIIFSLGIALRLLIKGQSGPFYLVHFVLLSCFIDLTAGILGWFGKNNSLIYNFFMIVEYLYWILFFISIFLNHPFKKIIAFTGVLGIIFSLYRVFNHNLMVFDTVMHTAISVGILIFVLLYFYHTLLLEVPHALETDPVFFLSAGLLFMYAGGLIFFNSLDYVMKLNKDFARKLYVIIPLLNTLLYMSYIAAMLCTLSWKKRRLSS